MNKNYMDLNSNEVLTLPRHNVECVLKKSMQVHDRVFETMSSQYYLNHIWKSGPKYIDRNAIRGNIDSLIRRLSKGLDAAAPPG